MSLESQYAAKSQVPLPERAVGKEGTILVIGYDARRLFGEKGHRGDGIVFGSAEFANFQDKASVAGREGCGAC